MTTISTIKVCGLSDISRMANSSGLDNLGFDGIIQWLDPNVDSNKHLVHYKNVPADKVLILRKDDTENCDPDGDSPDADDIQKILDFVKGKSRLLIACHAGVSRSTATAIGVMVADGFAIDHAINFIKRTRPCLFPNSGITKYFDAALGLNGTLSDAVAKLKGDIVMADKSDNDSFMFPNLIQLAQKRDD